MRESLTPFWKVYRQMVARIVGGVRRFKMQVVVSKMVEGLWRGRENNKSRQAWSQRNRIRLEKCDMQQNFSKMSYSYFECPFKEDKMVRS
jgi:hypothetical protein